MSDFWNSSFWRDLNEGDINFRDNLQFELKSKFPIKAKMNQNVFKQEIYMFIPETLQINRQTYLKDLFYADQTNLIRYQTPVLAFSALINPSNKRSPLYRLRSLLNKKLDKAEIVDELQLFASIFRSAFRKEVRSLVLDLQHQRFNEKETHRLLSEVKLVMDYYQVFKEEFRHKIKDVELLDHLNHIDEYFTDTIEYYLTGYLDRIKFFLDDKTEVAGEITAYLNTINNYRSANHLLPSKAEAPEIYHESILHRLSLLNKFVKEALRLKTDRIALQEKHSQAIGSLAAGIAMFVYMTLFAIASITWVNPPFVVTSFPIILIAVVLYILKDRLKEGLKILYKKHTLGWFPDYTTKIETPKGELLGVLKEYFSFINEKELPAHFLEIRNREFHEDLPTLKRHESIIEYRREVQLYSQPHKVDSRRKDLITIFRFNVHRFIEKANDSLQTYLKLEDDILIHEFLPKVYHLNIIIRNIYQNKRIEIDKFRVVIDKNGIKRVEKI